MDYKSIASLITFTRSVNHAEKFNDPDRTAFLVRQDGILPYFLACPKKKPPTFESSWRLPLSRQSSLLDSSLSTTPAVTARAVVGDVEPGAFEDDGRGRKHAAYLSVTVRASLQRRIAEMLATLKMQPTGQTFVFVHRHDDTSSSF